MGGSDRGSEDDLLASLSDRERRRDLDLLEGLDLILGGIRVGFLIGETGRGFGGVCARNLTVSSVQEKTSSVYQ